MKIVSFEEKHIVEAKLIAWSNYNEERSYVPVLPYIEKFPMLKPYADNGLGVAAFDGTKMLGFLCCKGPWDNAFNSIAKGAFSPVHAHGTVEENRSFIYKKLYQAAAEKWIGHKITYHAIGLYAHDKEAINSFFMYGFGLRCIDAVRSMSNFDCTVPAGIIFSELKKEDAIRIRELRRMLNDHLGSSPCFLSSTSQDFIAWISRAEERNSRLFIAKNGEVIISFVEVSDNGENFITEVDDMQNICGAYCLPEFRGTGVFAGLINYLITTLSAEGYQRLGVDFESFNPTATGFWMKYFSAYTNSVVRRIDECALHD